MGGFEVVAAVKRDSEEALAEENRRVLAEFSADPANPEHTREGLPGELWRACTRDAPLPRPEGRFL